MTSRLEEMAKAAWESSIRHAIWDELSPGFKEQLMNDLCASLERLIEIEKLSHGGYPGRVGFLRSILAEHDAEGKT